VVMMLAMMMIALAVVGMICQVEMQLVLQRR
jgi:hypothetical protein